MLLFRKNTNPKKLTLPEMWQVYQLLKVGGMTGDWLTDVPQILSKTSPYRMESSLRIFYGNLPKIKTGFDLVSLLVKGLTRNQFTLLDSFITRMVNHGKQ